MKLEKTLWQGEPVLNFSAGDYEAVMVPGVGANVIKLTNVKRQVEILRTPDNFEAFKSRPQVYGLPLLFPPNRIEDGTYTVNGKTYKLTITNIPKNLHCHGIIRTLPFNITRAEIIEKDEAVEIEASFISNMFNDAIYSYFDHEFECKLFYRLSKDGLEQKVTFINNSKIPMPLGVGFHSSFNVPFYKGSKREDYRLLASANENWELDSKNLPTGNIRPLNEFEKGLREGGMMPFVAPLDNAYSVKPLEVDGKEYHGAILVDIVQDIKVYYEVGKSYKHWTIWNSGADVNFVCVEPQTWAINAPNLDMPNEVTGFRLVNPNESWSEVSKIYVK